MFEPDYTETMSMLLEAIEKLQQDILPANELDKEAEGYLKGVGARRFDRAVPRRSTTSKDEAAVLTEDDDDDDGDHGQCGGGGGGGGIVRTDRLEREAPFSVSTSSSVTADKHTRAGDAEAMMASSFSYEDMAEGSRKSFGNSTILSREDSR